MNHKKGFTLVELLVTIAILGIIAGIGIDMFATIMRTYRKAEIFSLLERNGSQVLTQVEQDIRSSVDVVINPDGDVLTVSIPRGVAIQEKTYTFVECVDGGADGSVSVSEDGSVSSNLINVASENIIGETVYIRKLNGADFIQRTGNNVSVSFEVAAGSCVPADQTVSVVQQVSVNLRGGLE